MHLRGLLAGLAASSPLNTTLSPRSEVQCLDDCVRATIKPFVMAAGEEGFRQALGAHNTAETCRWSEDCRDTVKTFVEEIAHMVVKDRLQHKQPNNFNGSDGYLGAHCDARCLVRTVRTAAGQAGVVAMAVGDKHFYGNDTFWNRWSPRQILELDRAMRQLKGKNFGRDAYTYDGCENHLSPTRLENIFRFDLDAFRSGGSDAISLLYRPKITRATARTILSYIPGWGADPNAPDDDTEKFLFGDKPIQPRGSIVGDDLTQDLFDGDPPTQINVPMSHTHEDVYPFGRPEDDNLDDTEDYLPEDKPDQPKEPVPVVDLAKCPGFKKFDNETRKIMQEAYDYIHHHPASSQLDGFTYFLYHQRLYPGTPNRTLTLIVGESWDRVLASIDWPNMLTAPKEPETTTDVRQAVDWIWQLHAYGVSNDSRRIPEVDPNWAGPDYWSAGYAKGQNEAHDSRLTQWVTDSKAEPIKGVEEKGYAHQPWNNPWFVEYPTNYTTVGGFRIRGYTFELVLRRKAFEKDDGYHFRDNAFNASTGAVRDFTMLDRPDRFDDGWPYVTAITDDGRALRRNLGKGYSLSDGTESYDILNEDSKPVFTEEGKPIKIIYNPKTGLTETRYGRRINENAEYVDES